MASIDLTIRNKKKEAKRYEAYLKKLGKKKENQKKKRNGTNSRKRIRNWKLFRKKWMPEDNRLSG